MIHKLPHKEVFLAFIGEDNRVYISPFTLSDKEIKYAARLNQSFYTVRGTKAKFVAKQCNNGYDPLLHETNKKGYYDHYHIYKVNYKSHFFFGFPK